MGAAIDKVLKFVGEGTGAGSPFMPSTRPSDELLRLRGEHINRYLFKHPKKGFHGRKAWSVETLEKTTIEGGRPVTRVYRASTQQFGDKSFAMAAANHCPDCGVQSVKGAMLVKGDYDPDITCDARCTNATGPNCDCSCGGKNHGLGWG